MSESRVEKFLKAAMTEEKETDLPKPMSRVEELLNEMAEKGISGGGGADWNAAEGEPGYVKNRTHYEETVEAYGDTLTWDGDTEGLALFNIGYNVYKVSDAVPTMADLENGATINLSDSLEVTECNVRESMPGLILIDAGSVVVISESVAGTEIGGIMLPEAGTYLYKRVEGDVQYVASLTIPGYTGFKTTTTNIKTIDPKFLPDIGGTSIDVVAEVGQTIIVEEVDGFGKPTKWKAADYQERTHWSEVVTGDLVPHMAFTPVMNEDFGMLLYNLPTFDFEEGKTYTVVFDGVEYTGTAAAGVYSGMPFVSVGNTVLHGVQSAEPFVVVKIPAMNVFAVVCFTADEHTIQIIGEKTVYHKIPREYLSSEYRAIITNSVTGDGFEFCADWEELRAAVRAKKNVFVDFSYHHDDGSFALCTYRLMRAHVGMSGSEMKITDTLFFVSGTDNINEAIFGKDLAITRYEDGTMTSPSINNA